MPIRSSAVVFEAPGKVGFRTVECPDPGPQDVVVRTEYSWISIGTEGSFLRGERSGDETARLATDPWPFPLVPGYQKVGTLEWLGGAVAGFALGDRVFASWSRVSGMYVQWGGHLSRAVTPADSIEHIPDRPHAEAFSGAVLAQVGYNCGHRPTLAEGDPVVVIGDGLVGQWAAQTLWSRGADVLLLGHHIERLDRFGPRALAAVELIIAGVLMQDFVFFLN